MFHVKHYLAMNCHQSLYQQRYAGFLIAKIIKILDMKMSGVPGGS